MLDIGLRYIGFSFLFLRFAYWVGISFENTVSKKVLLALALEGCLLLGIFGQMVGQIALVSFPSTMLSSLIGFGLVVIDVVGSWVARGNLGYAWTHAASARIKPKQQVVTRGLYSFVRHPIYTCFVLSYVGIELLIGSWLWVSFLFFFLPAYFQAKKEEKLLQQHFGGKFVIYKKKTKMLIPFLF